MATFLYFFVGIITAMIGIQVMKQSDGRLDAFDARLIVFAAIFWPLFWVFAALNYHFKWGEKWASRKY